MRINTSKPKTKIIIILSAIVMTALVAVLISAFWSGAKPSAGFETDLRETGGIEGFLEQFLFEVDSEISKREITLPQRDDKVFSEYAELLQKSGFKLLELSGKKVEERYLKLKNKTEKGKTLYAVVLVLKERVVAVHLTTFEQGSELIFLGETLS